MKTIDFDQNKLKKLQLANPKSHKGDNGRVLVIGGSSLFHSASLWAAELLAHFVDLVFYYSPYCLNSQLYLDIKRRFKNGIVVEKKDLNSYIEQAEVVLIGPGLMRQGKEGETTKKLTKLLLTKYPSKKIVIDAGSLQMLSLIDILPQHILTPHFLEFENLFGKCQQDFGKILHKYPATYLLKKEGIDYVFSHTNKQEVIKIKAGNQGLTKGGSGDLLAALCAALYVKNEAKLSAIVASYVLNMAAQKLYQKVGPYYTTTELLMEIPVTFWEMLKKAKNLG